MDHKIFYHYTDFQALDGILRCAQLRVNNVLRMNDSAEMRHFMVRLSSAITARLEASGDYARAQEIRVLFQEELRREYSAFAACFSFRRDDAAEASASRSAANSCGKSLWDPYRCTRSSMKTI